MAFHFHQDKQLYFEFQRDNSAKYVIPFIEQAMPLRSGMRVMEIGCGEGGVLKAFIDRGCQTVGLDLSPERIEYARSFMQDDEAKGNIQLIAKDIYDLDPEKDLAGKFDIIILKDAIEHIPNQEKIISFMKTLLNEGGGIFFGFPPWTMPFGGHQQICHNKLLGLLPYYHLLPMPLYIGIVRALGENEWVQNELRDIKNTGISTHRFERIAKNTGYNIALRQLYLVNPIYEYKFKLKPRQQFGWLAALPIIRDFFTTTAYYLIRPI